MRIARLAMALAALATLSCARPPGPPSILLITVDTLRPDHLGSWGRPGPTSPALDALARQGTVWPSVQAPRGQTWPTLASILSSRYPVEHGVRKNGQAPSPDLPTLTGALRERGYVCGAFLSNSGQAGWPDFDVVEDLRDRDATLLARAKGWLRARADRRFFLWIHFFAPHRPFEPSPVLAERFDPGYRGPIDGSIEQMRAITASGIDPAPDDLAHMIALYDAEIRGLDRHVRDLLAALDELGLTGRTLVAFTADHGEELYERNRYFSHSASIYDTVLRLPLVLCWPGHVPAGRLVPGIAEAIDIAPTLLDVAGLPIPPDMRGRSLRAVMEGQAAPDRSHAAFAELEDRVVSVRTERWRYIHNPDGHAFPMEGGETGMLYPIAERELYDHVLDPGERHNLAGESPEVVAEFAAIVGDWMAAHDWEEASRRHAERAIPDDVRESLEAIGYLN
jgi:arylsulfatase A-like enzyme